MGVERAVLVPEKSITPKQALVLSNARHCIDTSKQKCSDQCNTLSDPSMYLYTSINTPSYTTSTTNMDHEYVREEEEEENVGRRREEERGVVAGRGF
jgi:hypothetical protein